MKYAVSAFILILGLSWCVLLIMAALVIFGGLTLPSQHVAALACVGASVFCAELAVSLRKAFLP